MSIAETYNQKVFAGEITRDPAQEHAAREMDGFLNRFKSGQGAGGVRNVLDILQRKKLKKSMQVLYVYGGVGRGKSMLMDMMAREAKGPRTRRVHFHAFMLEIHARLKSLRELKGTVDDYIGQVAKSIADETDLFCFDELHVNDIADAMILGPLFHNLMQDGVAVVATSNYAPDDLYKGGLQRDRFLPFIELLKKQMQILHLDSPTDYRLRALSEQGTWFFPLIDQSWSRMENLFETLTGHAPTPPDTMNIEGRALPIQRTDGIRAWVDFDTLCREARGAVDYLALGHTYPVVFLDNVPRMSQDNHNELRRFMTLVDTLYDLGRVLVVRAATSPDKLYGGDSHSFEYQRTLSRLLEMQSPDWIAKRTQKDCIN